MDNLLLNLYTGELQLFDFGQEIDIYNLLVENNISVGHQAFDITIAAATIDVLLATTTEGAADLGNFLASRHANNAALGAHLLLARSRGLTHGAEAVVADNDLLGCICGVGYDGTDYALSSRITFEVDDPTPAATDMGGAIVMYTALAGTEALVERLRIENTGRIIANDTGIDSDFQIKGLTDDNLFYVDASADRIGIHVNTPGVKLDLEGGADVALSGTAYRLAKFSFNADDKPGIILGYDATAGAGVIAASTQAAGADIDFWTYTGAAWRQAVTISKVGVLAVSHGSDSSLLTLNKSGVGVGNAGAITNAGTGNGLYIDQNGVGVSLHLDTDVNDGAAIFAQLVQCTNAGAGIAGGIDLSDANLDRVIKVAADATDPTGDGGAATGRIPIDVGGATVYIAYY